MGAGLGEFATAKTIQSSEPLLWVEKRLQQNSGAYASNVHLVGTETKLLWQPHGLAPAITEELRYYTLRHCDLHMVRTVRPWP